MKIKKYKQILITCVLVIIIFVGIGIYIYFNNKSNEEYFSIKDNLEDKTDNQTIDEIQTNNTNEEIKESTEDNSLSEEGKIAIHIIGQVVNPGVVKLKEGARVVEAIEAAGGQTEEADLTKINLAYILEDGSKIYVPSVKDKDEDIYRMEGDSPGSKNIGTYSTGGNSSNSNTVLKVNINTANSNELQKLPGIGEAIANRIIAYRKENGKFNSIEDLKNVSGIGESKFKNIKEYVYIK